MRNLKNRLADQWDNVVYVRDPGRYDCHLVCGAILARIS